MYGYAGDDTYVYSKQSGTMHIATAGSETATSSAADGAASSEPSVQDIGEANLDLLQPADDARDVQILSVADGSITSLREAVDGDRPVLLWFWSPH